MNRRLLSLTFQLALIPGAGGLLAGCESPDGPSLRVVTWNVHACRAGVDRIAADLRRLEADVVCLQEVTSGQLDSPEANAVERLARALDMRCVCTPAPAAGTKEEQMAILARGKLDGTEYLEANTGRRYGISAETELADGSAVRLVCVHMTSNAPFVQFGRFLATGGRRLKETDDLARRLREWDEDVILAGDFNATPVMLEHATLRSRARWAVSLEPTFPAVGSMLQLDHVFVKGRGLRPGLVVAEATDASDHRRLLADIRLTDRWTLTGLAGRALFEAARTAGD